VFPDFGFHRPLAPSLSRRYAITPLRPLTTEALA